MQSRLIDVREYAEYAQGFIPGAQNFPLPTLPGAAATWNRDEPLQLICKSGKRALQAQSILAAAGFTRLTVLSGGMDQWIAGRQPIEVNARRPWSLERQVRFTAGTLILISLALAFGISRYFLLATTLVGAGLVFAGASDICMMATVLGWLPWNKQASASR
jgi:rhodanese-related sulfurtransferase